MESIHINIRNMKYSQMIDMNNTLHSLVNKYSGNISVIFNFNNLKWIDPSGAIILLETIKNLEEENIKIEYCDLDLDISPISYGLNMGIFQRLGLSNSESKEEGPNYLAPKKIYMKEVYNYLNKENQSLESYFEIISEKITNKVIRDSDTSNDDRLKKLFNYVVRELIRNIFDHSNCEYFYYGSQYLPNRKIVELVIADRGIGLKNTVPFNIEEKWNNLDSAENAIQKAFTPGITAASNHSYASEDYMNSGFGLAMVRSLISTAEGTLCLATSDKAVTYNTSAEWFDCNIQGTLLRFRVDLDKLMLVDFDDQLEQVYKEAQSLNKSFIPSRKSQTL